MTDGTDQPHTGSPANREISPVTTGAAQDLNLAVAKQEVITNEVQASKADAAATADQSSSNHNNGNPAGRESVISRVDETIEQSKQSSSSDQPKEGENPKSDHEQPQDDSKEFDNNSTPNDLFQDSIFGTPGTNSNLTPNEGSLSNVDVNSLLPGLEYYANDNSADGTFDGLATMTNGDRTDFFSAADMAGGANQDGQLQRDSNMNFDDFFANFGGDSGGGGGGFGAPPAEAEEPHFDESFFNLDG